jgi:membrane fusion protein (multidrug efflux system)
MKKIFFAPLLILIFLACKEKNEVKNTTDASKSGLLSVEGMIVNQSELAEGIEVAGNILPFELTEIRSEISGRMTKINFKEGASVVENELLVKLFDGELQAQLKKLKVQLEIAEKTEERERELLKISGISQQDYDLSLLQVNNIKADIELIEVAIGKTEIRAPYSGRMGLRNVSPGAYLTPANIISTISQVKQKKISFSVPEKYSNEIKAGMTIEFTIEGNDDVYMATILAAESVIEAETRNLKILATVKDGNNMLVPGTFAKVKLTLSRNADAILIPTQCIIPTARTKQVIAYRNGKPEFVNVTTGLRASENIQITSGLKNGDTIVTTGLLFVRKDSNLKLSKVQ